MLRNRTHLEELQDEVERGVAKAFPLALLEAQFERHTRRGQRACDCEYCNRKRIGTAEVATATRRITWDKIPSSYNRVIRRYGSCGYRYQDEWLLKHNVRENVRKTVRADLEAIKARP